MASSRHVDAFVRRLGDGIAREIHGRTMLSGFGVPQPGAAMVAALRRANVVWPLHKIARGTILSRSAVQSAAAALGLPPEWARVSHRAPAEGAGIRDWLEDRTRACTACTDRSAQSRL